MAEHEFKYTQCIVMRGDLKTSKGKMAGQAAHASVGAMLEQSDKVLVKEWFEEGQRKVVLKGECELQLFLLRAAAVQDFGIPAYLVEDFGITEFHGVKTVTCLGLGPCTIEKMNQLTNGLKLF